MHAGSRRKDNYVGSDVDSTPYCRESVFFLKHCDCHENCHKQGSAKKSVCACMENDRLLCTSLCIKNLGDEINAKMTVDQMISYVQFVQRSNEVQRSSFVPPFNFKAIPPPTILPVGDKTDLLSSGDSEVDYIVQKTDLEEQIAESQLVEALQQDLLLLVQQRTRDAVFNGELSDNEDSDDETEGNSDLSHNLQRRLEDKDPDRINDMNESNYIG